MITQDNSPSRPPTQPVDDPEVLKSLSPIFLEDFQRCRSINEAIFHQLLEHTKPEDAVHLTNNDKNMFSEYLNILLLLKRRGYGIHFSDDATDIDNNPLPYLVSVSALPEDVDAVEKITDGIMFPGDDGEPYPYLRLMGRISFYGDKIYSFTLDPRHSHHRETVAKLALPRAELMPNLSRAFLSGLLSETLNDSNSHGGLDSRLLENNNPPFQHRPFSDLPLYEKLRERGVKPFTPEEVQGVVSGAINLFLEANPDTPKPFSKRTEEE